MGNGVGSLFNNAHHLTRLLKGRDPSVLPEFPKPGTGPGIQDRQNMYVKKRKWDKDIPGQGNTRHKGTEPLCVCGDK